MTEIRFTRMERAVGGFIFLAFLTLVAALIAAGRGQDWFQRTQTYYTYYKEGYNLQPGVKVKLLRADIGKVTNIEITADNRVKVTMSILARYADSIKVDSVAAVESSTLFFGSSFINIIPGSPDSAVIKDGGTIPSKEEKRFSDYMEEYNVQGKMAKLDEILQHLAGILDQARKNEETVIETMANLEKLTRTIAEGKGTLGRLVNEDELYRKFAADLEALENILASLEKAAEAVERGARSVESGADSTRRTAARLEKDVPAMLTRIQNILKNLDLALKDAPELSREARRGMREANRILESVKRSIWVRGNLPQPDEPETHGLEFRGD